MTFPNAAKGIKKILLGEVLILLAAMLLSIVEMNVTGGTISSTFTTIGICAMLLILVGFVLNLIGIIGARKDDEGFNWAFYLTVCGILCSLLLSTFQSNANMTRWLNPAKTLCELFASYYVLTGIINIAGKLRDTKTAGSAKAARTWLIGAYIASAMLAQIVVALATNGNGAVVAVGLASLVVEVITYIIYIRALMKGNAMLNA